MSNQIAIPKARFFKTGISGTNRNVGLDIIRACCILLVVFFHTNNYGGKYTGAYKVLFPLGFAAQELLFALSGFLVAQRISKYITSETTFRGLINFYKNRWTRTIPFYYVFLAFNIILFYTIHRYSNSELYTNTPFSIFRYLTFTQNLYDSHPYFYPEIWSLPMEEISFLLLPLPFACLISYKNGFNIKRQIWLIVLAIGAATLYRTIYIFNCHPEFDWGIRKIVIYRLDALLYGFLISMLIREYPGFFRKNKYLFLIAGCLLPILFYFLKVNMTYDLFNALYFTIIPVSVSLVLPFFHFYSFDKLSKKIIALTTHFSITGYSILLSHLYFIQFSMLTVYVPRNLSESLMFTVIYLAIVVAFSTLFFNYIEQPILMRRKKL